MWETTGKLVDGRMRSMFHITWFKKCYDWKELCAWNFYFKVLMCRRNLYMILWDFDHCLAVDLCGKDCKDGLFNWSIQPQEYKDVFACFYCFQIGRKVKFWFFFFYVFGFGSHRDLQDFLCQLRVKGFGLDDLFEIFSFENNRISVDPIFDSLKSLKEITLDLHEH